MLGVQWKMIAVVGLALALAGPCLSADERLRLETRTDPRDGGRVSEGTYRVFENRARGVGRTLDLEVVVLHATSERPRPDPVFVLAGGPGANAVGGARGYRGHWMRRDRDIVLVSQRGTAGDHALNCRLPGSDTELQGYLGPIFDETACRAAVAELSRRADLTQYATPIAMDDLDDVRRALGYDRINLSGGSYGTRAALVYLRRHPETVRTAVLMGVAPLMFKNPLYHAWSAQQGLERLADEIDADPEYRRAFPRFRERFEATLARLADGPARVTIRHPATGEPADVMLTRDGFAEGLRTLMYYAGPNRRVPLLLKRAYFGDVAPFAEASVNQNRGIRNMLAFGMLLSVTAAEDVARITEEEIVRLTEGTFLGDGRVRRQAAVCAFWPKSELPEGFGEPVVSNVPTLIISGTHDPVTPPAMGDEVARHFTNGRHLVLPGAHGISHPALTEVIREFLDEGSVDDLDLTPLERVRLPRLVLPESH